MKNSMCYFCSVLFLLLILGSNSFAQESTSSMQFSLFGGLSLPQGDFGSTANAKNENKAGFANTGFCAMVEGSKSLNENVMWVSSLSLALNSMDEDAIKSDYFNSDYSVTAGSYLTVLAMTGIGYETAISPTIDIYGLGQIGLLLSSVPDIKGTIANYSSGNLDVNITTKMGASFAYGFGGGIKINKINIGLRYYSSEPEYEITGNSTYTSGSYTSKDTKTEKFKKPVTVLQLLVGFNF